MKKRLLSFLWLATALLLGSCKSASKEPEPMGKLLDTRWMLAQMDETSIAVSSYADDYTSYLQLTAAGKTARIRATCNEIGGTFALGAGPGRLTISPQAATRISCPVPYLSDRYLAALPQTTRYEIDGTTLRLYDAQAVKPRLVFQAAP